MDKEKLLSLLLPGLSGSLSITLNDHQLYTLALELLHQKASHIKGIASKDGFVHLNLNIPVIRKLDVEIVSIEISSSKLRTSLRILNIKTLFLKPVIYMLGILGFKGKMNEDLIVVDFSEKWKHVVASLQPEVISKLNCIVTQVDTHNNALDILISLK
ncbi:hypothetical protein MASR2M64_08190 [Candidatus Cloacimonadota bacterium]|nr:hypothetical protein [Candidatus Cloacimonadota bacterium]MDD3235417.1 hypothetical protein [Candidatus Cloacimonadota bacterium]